MLGVLLILMFVSSCGSQQATQERGGSRTQSTELSTAIAPTSADQATVEKQPTPGASTTLPEDSQADPTSPEGATHVIRDYYDAINEREYERAYDHWDRDGSASGQTLEQFEQGLAETKHVDVQIGEPGREDAAAGSLFIEIPVAITATTNDAGIQRFSGTYSLRRVNDVPGATEDQLTWHIYAAYIAEADSTG
jgi:hypothetical protein